jgi:hypothetical protein
MDAFTVQTALTPIEQLTKLLNGVTSADKAQALMEAGFDRLAGQVLPLLEIRERDALFTTGAVRST